MNTILETHHLHVDAGKKNLFTDLNLKFMKGHITALIGENGVGKSSLLHYLAGIAPPSKGHVTLNNLNIAKLTNQQRAQSLVHLPQTCLAESDLLVESRIASGLAPQLGPHHLLNPHALNRLQFIGDRLGISHTFGRRLGTLSGGERKRVQIARALIHETADIYLLDEPYAGVDLKHQSLITKAIQHLKTSGKTIIITVHDIHVLLAVSDRVLALGEKKVIAECETAKLTEKTIENTLHVHTKIYPITNSFFGALHAKNTSIG